MRAVYYRQLWLLCQLALLGCEVKLPDHFKSILLSQRGFVQLESQMCLQSQFVVQEPAIGTFAHLGAAEACARLCWYQVTCRGFKLNTTQPSSPACQFFTFDGCAEDLNIPDCTNRAIVWLRWKPVAKGFSRHSPICPIGFLDQRFGSSRFQLVNVNEYTDGWLGGLQECRHSSGLVKFADADTNEEAAFLLTILEQHYVQAAYLSGYFGYLNGVLRWLWQPCKEAINDSVLNSSLLSLQRNVTVIRQKGWTGVYVSVAVCECLDPFSIN